ncbi:bifunctional alpha,alpha-trehalose-phosphate synthase (UDP-forming)/trehalose-phosphatase [Aeromicrobium sp.]|nr:bifunctional alpha,alpha-trehalose-phosphate synthase (UDP-forming)/trehalose-phosphatase [Candidatus Saccharibacteria bacterium]
MQPGLIIVSNRLPISVKKIDGHLEFSRGEGGLANGLASYTKSKKNKWIGWPGIASEELTERDRQQISEELAKSNCYPVFMTKKQIDDFYNGYSNSILWPLFHDSEISDESWAHEESWWKAYQRVNELFAETVFALSNVDDTVWVHDYHLLILPALLRLERPYNQIGFFLHIPFPEPDRLQRLKNGETILAGMLGSNLVGLHVGSYVKNFMDNIKAFDIGIASKQKVILQDRAVRVTDFPLGIDYAKYVEARKSSAVNREYAKLRVTYSGMKVILTVDRLEPAKGLIERLEAYRGLLEQNPKLIGKVVLVMQVFPSRLDVKEYYDLSVRLEKLVREINREFRRPGWLPVDYMFKSLPFARVTALFRRADVAFIAPLRDGMNLVAKEYLASKPSQNGVLVLSKTAGAAEELKEAVMVDPNKPSSLVRGLVKALDMKPTELKRRVRKMQRQLEESDVNVWANKFTRTLKQEVRVQPIGPKALHDEKLDDIAAPFGAAKHRLVLLDYDGVLERFHDDPANANPPKDLKKILERLSKKAEVVIISGRRKSELETWFKDLPVSLVAEHGAFSKRLGSVTWRNRSDPKAHEWKSHVWEVMDRYASKTPGSTVETKDASLVWHYRNAAPYASQKYLVILRRLLRPIAKKYGLSIEQGNKILEVRSGAVNKGLAAQTLIKPSTDFIMAIGDDYTDEDMFNLLPPRTYSVKVGTGHTNARFRLKDVTAVHTLLTKLAK